MYGYRRESSGPDLVEGLLDSSVQGFGRVTGEVDLDLVSRESRFDMGAKSDRPLRPFPDEDATPLPGNDQALIAEDHNILLDGHPGNRIARRKLRLRRQ